MDFRLAGRTIAIQYDVMSASSIPHTILSPPDSIPEAPPARTRIQCLPFEDLTWENFERLCHRLIAQESNVEYCARYGRQGDAQEGIDIFARLSGGSYYCLQAKRHRSYGAAKLKDAVDLFLAGTWADRTTRFTIAVQAPLRSIAVQEEIECQAARLRRKCIQFMALDGAALTDLLRDHPVLIDDFFGRPWVDALLGEEIANRLSDRLDGTNFALVRSQLARVYEAHFQFVDPGSFGSVNDGDGRPALTLLERFIRPDILVREASRTLKRADVVPESEHGRESTQTPFDAMFEQTQTNRVVSNNRTRRFSLVEWLNDGERIVVLGEAGCGKSTLLRVIALDLLHNQTEFPELAARWGQYLPVYIPFARWSAQVARDGGTIGIKEIVRRSLEQLLTRSIADLLDRAIEEKRVLFLVDGLDEWNSEQAARSTLNALVTTVEAHGVPVVVSGRPRGLSRIGALPATWKRGEIAPLSVPQQGIIAGRWFQRYATTEQDFTGVSDGSLRTNRFMAELARDANLGALAAVPLLLVGLVTLALRGQILPRTKIDVYDQLVRILLEVHPDRRATASGDTESRFRYATDPDQRRAAIAKLAFSVREAAADAGMSVASARRILRDYLASPQGFDLAESDASAAATEILSVNAETQGIIVERRPGEVGFVHASFEEFLGAEHIGSWPLVGIENFVRLNSGNGRWRNVIANLLCTIHRRDEFNRLVAVIEETETDELLRFHKEALLGEIAFGAAARSPATAKRLALATMRRVEMENWAPARREALASMLKGLSDPTLKSDVEQRLRRWMPARLSYREGLIAKFGDWEPTAALDEVLWQAMHDEDRGVQRTAAAAYARALAPSPDACQRLLDGLAQTRDLSAAAAMLECLALGWPTALLAKPLFEEAYNSHSGELRLAGILGLAELGELPEKSVEVLLHEQNYWSDVSYPHRTLASTMLMKYWPSSDRLVKGALRRTSDTYQSHWELDTATGYLLESEADRDDVRSWILQQFDKDYPFNVLRNDRVWAQVGRFAKADPAIRNAANTYWSKPRSHILDLHKLPAYVAQVADAPVAAVLLEILRKQKRGFDRFWALKALLVGWGRHHLLVKEEIDKLIAADDDDVVDLLSLIPSIMPNNASARDRLLRMAKRQDIRRDLLALGLEAAGCDHSDEAAVHAILEDLSQLKGTFDFSYVLLRAFGLHPRVRALALDQLSEADGALAAVAAAYPNDPQFADSLFKAAIPLPVELRTQIVEAAATGAAGTALEAILSQGMLETDPELRVRMVIAHHRALPQDARDAAKATLLAKAVAVGSDYDAIRAAALAGLVTIDGLGDLVSLQDNGKPVDLETGSVLHEITSVKRLICERFAEFQSYFGETLPERLRTRGDNSIADVLSEAPNASPEARETFIALAEQGKIPRTPAALRALAIERPRSDLLITRCWEALDSTAHRNDQVLLSADIAIIFREQFLQDQSLLLRLSERYRKSRSIANALLLFIFDPDTDLLPAAVDSQSLGRQFGDWALAVHVAARRSDNATFCDLLTRVVTRTWRSPFDAQSIINFAVEERLQLDLTVQQAMAEKITIDAHPSVSGSFARYLASAGKLGPEERERALHLMRMLKREQSLPVAGYDAVSDQWRAIRATLLDAASAGLEIV